MFSTNGRAAWLSDDSFRTELHGDVNGIGKLRDSPALTTPCGTPAECDYEFMLMLTQSALRDSGLLCLTASQ